MYISNSVLFGYEDYHHIKILRKLRKKAETEFQSLDSKSYYYHRFSNPSYLRQVFKAHKVGYKQEAIYKRISQGSGLNALKNTIQYLMHKTKEHEKKNIPLTNLYDHNGNKLSDNEIEKLFIDWQNEFSSKKFAEKYPERYLTLRQFHDDYQIIKTKESKGDLTQKEADQLAEIRTGYVRKSIWERGTHVELENYSKGRIERVEDNNKVVIALDDQTHQKYKTLQRDDLKPTLTKEKWGIKKNTQVDIKREALDDSGYMVDSPNFAQAQKYLPKDFEHLVLSVGGDKPDTKKAFEATQEHIKENLYLRGFKCVFAMHEENKNLHFHVLVHRRNFIDYRQKFPTGMHDSYIFRAEFADKLNQKGIDQTATFKQDRINHLEVQRQKSEKMLQSSRRFRSMKKNPEAATLFANYYTLNQAMDKIDEKLDDLRDKKEITAKQKAEIKQNLEISRIGLKLDNEDTFDMNVRAFEKSLRSKSEQIADYWAEELSAEKLKERMSNLHKKKKERQLEAQNKITERLKESYEGIELVKKHFIEDGVKTQKIEELEELQEQTVELINFSDALYKQSKDANMGLKAEKYIQKDLDLSDQQENREELGKEANKSKSKSRGI